MEIWKLGNRSARVRRRRSRRDGKRMDERKKERGRWKTTERSKKWPWAAGELLRRNDFSRIAAADWVSMADWN